MSASNVENGSVSAAAHRGEDGGSGRKDSIVDGAAKQQVFDVDGVSIDPDGAGVVVVAPGGGNDIGYKDRGYSWVILATVIANYCLVAIGLGAVGVLYPHFIGHFECSKYEAGWIGSLHMAVGALIGLFLSPVFARFGCRPVAMFGGVVGSLGYSSSYLSRTVGQMYITFGILAGIGNGLLLISSSVMLQQYFDRRRTIATALATTGFGLSPLIVAPLTRWMTETLGWRWAILLLGCAYMQGAVFSSLLRPVPRATSNRGTEAHELKEVGAINGKPVDDVTAERRGLRHWMTSLCRAFNMSLLIDIRFIVFAGSSSIAVFGYFAPFVFLPSHAQRLRRTKRT